MKFLYGLLLTCCSLVVLSSCSTNNVHDRKDWTHYFTDKEIAGSIMLHNTALNTFEICNIQGTQNRYSPAASFNIMLALTGLETGVVSDTNMVWRDSLDRPVEGIGAGETMGEAFRASDEAYFREISRRVGKARMQFWLDSVKYGNMAIGLHVDRFWQDNTLKISPDEQLGLLQKLYYGKLPFQSRSQRLVKQLLLREKTEKYAISYVAGNTRYAEKQVGWIIGWVEEKKRPHFFVINVETPGTYELIDRTVHDILYDILREQNLIEKK